MQVPCSLATYSSSLVDQRYLPSVALSHTNARASPFLGVASVITRFVEPHLTKMRRTSVLTLCRRSRSAKPKFRTNQSCLAHENILGREVVNLVNCLECKQAHRSVVEFRSTKRVCVGNETYNNMRDLQSGCVLETNICGIFRSAERVCVGDQRDTNTSRIPARDGSTSPPGLSLRRLPYNNFLC